MTKVRLYCYEPLAADPGHEQPWSDTWLEVELENGETLKRAPCIQGLVELEAEIKLVELKAEIKAEKLLSLERLRQLYEIVSCVEDGGWHCESPDKTPTLTAPYYMVTKAVVEEGIRWYLARYHDIEDCELVWEESDGPFVEPV